MSVMEIFEAMEARCEATGLEYIPHGAMDADHDTFPAITLFDHPDKGIQSDEDQGKSTPKKSMQTYHLVVEIQIQIQHMEKWRAELETQFEEVRPHILDVSDPTLGKLARQPLKLAKRTTHLQGEYGRTGAIQATIEIPFSERS